MIRGSLAKSGGAWNGIPWRSQEINRIEGLSDGVFAFAVTLLIVSLEVPETFTDLWVKMQGFGSFAISFSILFQVWYTQHIFFRRYGLQDTLTVVLNGVLLFLVLFYMYPLKFLFGMLVNEVSGGGGLVHLSNGQTMPMLQSAEEGVRMMVIYGIGFAAVFGLFTLLYFHAWRKRHEMELSDAEIYDARSTMRHNALLAGVPLLSILVALTSGSPNIAGYVYILIGPVVTVNAMLRGRKRRQLYGRTEK
jgi:hypothetical protein